jgi:Ni/Co efflux regulator RcnB
MLVNLVTPDRPTPPADLPQPVLDELGRADPEDLRRIAEYAAELASYRDQRDASDQGDRDDKNNQDDRDDQDDRGPEAHRDPPDGVPGNATLTEKEINDNRYYYWQWRDGDTIKSKYEGPVSE